MLVGLTTCTFSHSGVDAIEQPQLSVVNTVFEPFGIVTLARQLGSPGARNVYSILMSADAIIPPFIEQLIFQNELAQLLLYQSSDAQQLTLSGPGCVQSKGY